MENIQNNASYFLCTTDKEVEELKFKIKKVIKNK